MVINKTPKVLFICDVKNWAWYYKSLELQKYLSDEFDIDIACVLAGDKINPKAYDIYFTFGYSYIDIAVLKDVPKEKKITGVTAHRPLEALRPKMNQAIAVHANSILLANELIKIHELVYYLPNGVNEELFTYQSMPEKRDNIIIGHVGKLSQLKGQREFIEPAVKKAKCLYHPHYNSHNEALSQKAMIYSVYKQMDAIVVASTEDGTPNPALEAAACGRPIISNYIGNMPEFIQDGINGFLVDKNVDAYVEKILWFKNNRDKMIKMGKEARKTVEMGWTWRIQAENYRKIINDVLNMAGKDVEPKNIKKEQLLQQAESISKTKNLGVLSKKPAELQQAENTSNNKDFVDTKKFLDEIETKIRVKIVEIKDSDIKQKIKKVNKSNEPEKHMTVLERERAEKKNDEKRLTKLDNVVDRKVIKKPIPVFKPEPLTKKVKEIVKKSTVIIQPEKPKITQVKDPNKLSILLLVDVVGWAWDEKAKNLKKWLSDEFNICIRYFQTSPVDKFDRSENFDLYFTFECGSARFVNERESKRKITGVTSHTFTSLRGPWKQGLESSGTLHANSMLLQKQLQDMFPKKTVYYVPNGVDEEKFSYWERNINEPFQAAYVGKNTKRKGYEDFVVPACKQAGVKLKSQTCRFNSPNVIKHKNMPDFYNDVDVILIASDMDGTPNQLLESAAKGRTFIGNKIGNVPEFVDEGINGFLIERRVKNYVEKLKYLKENRTICKEMGLAARKTIEDEWTWKIQAENYRKMFRNTLNEV